MSISEGGWRLYICRACGYIYDEQEGDPDSGLAPGTRFEDIPDDWECPLCGVKKADFELFERPVVEQNNSNFKTSHSKEPGIIVIGGGIAGWSMVEAIRRQNSAAMVTLITACSGDVYHKPELSVAIAKKMDKNGLIREKGSEASRRLAINLLANTYVVGISPPLNMLRTTRGSFQYTRLILAQGARNVLPKGLPAEWCWRINHIDAWSGLELKLKQKPSRIAIIGGGMVGCELAENLSLAGHQVALIFRHETPLYNLIPDNAGKRFSTYLQQQGVRCISDTVIDVSEHKSSSEEKSSDLRSYKLKLSSGEALTVDQIVTATGLEVDQRLPNMAKLKFDKGIVVDPQTLETSQPNIYALGDCISIFGESCRFISPIAQQAKVIATQIFDKDQVTYEHKPPTIRLKVQACSLVLYGQPVANTPWKTISEDGECLTMEQWSADKLVSRLVLSAAG